MVQKENDHQKVLPNYKEAKRGLAGKVRLTA
jgi:hypothetical protein